MTQEFDIQDVDNEQTNMPQQTGQPQQYQGQPQQQQGQPQQYQGQPQQYQGVPQQQQGGQMPALPNVQQAAYNDQIMDKGNYQGDMNGLNQRHGYGTCSYMDGSVYEGNWQFDEKQGEGVIQFMNGAKFQGNYIKDKRNGPGMLVFPNGNKVEASWQNDMINGEGKYYKNNIPIDCVWNDDVKFELNSSDSNNQMYYFLVLQILFLILLIISLDSNNIGLLIFALLIYLELQCVCFCVSKTFKYINNLASSSEMSHRLQKLKETPPQQKFSVQCYHYETRYKKHTDSQGNTTTTEREERVNTYYYKEYFKYESWADKSADIYSLEYMKKLKMVRLQMNKVFEYTHESYTNYKEQVAHFKEFHFRDTHNDYNETKEVQGYEEFMLVQNDQEGLTSGPPFYLTTWFSILSSLLTFHWTQIYLLQSTTKKVEWDLKKLFIK